MKCPRRLNLCNFDMICCQFSTWTLCAWDCASSDFDPALLSADMILDLWIYHIEFVHCMGIIPFYFVSNCFLLPNTRYFLLWFVWVTSKLAAWKTGLRTVHCRRLLLACIRTCIWLAMWTTWRASSQTLHIQWSKCSIVPGYFFLLILTACPITQQYCMVYIT
jgi:hypothetical protein